MIDAFEENELDLESNSKNESNELTLAAIKDYLISKGGKVKYSELFYHFKHQINDSQINETKFQEFLSNLAVRKYENDFLSEEWVILKKVYKEVGTTSPPNSGFFASKLQKTKQSLTKFSNTFHHSKDKDTSNKSLNLSCNSLNNNNNNNSNNTSTTTNKNNSMTSHSASNLSDVTFFKMESKNKIKSLDTRQYILSSNDDLVTMANSIDLSNKQTSTDLEKVSVKSLNFDDVGVRSVKEQANKLNRLNTESEIKNDVVQKSRTYSTGKETTLSASLVKNIDIEYFDLSDPKPHEKEWLLICSRSDYMDMAKILSKIPYLAQKKDPFTGYTCAHWACKYGSSDILKLIASTLENDTKTNPKSIRINNLINSKTRAGYTCLHIAYMFKHGDLAPLLKTYGAEGLIDFSGKQAIDYSKPQNHMGSGINDGFNELKVPNIDMNSDANSIVKRSSSVLFSKEKEIKDPFNSMRLMENKSSNKPKIGSDLFLNRNQRPASPLAFLESSNNKKNSQNSFPMAQSTNVVGLKNKNKTISNEGNNQSDEQSKLRESKENIFI